MKWATLLIGLFVAANGHEDSEDPDHTHGKNVNILPKSLHNHNFDVQEIFCNTNFT